MKLRIMGTSEEVQELTELLPVILNVSSVSKEYPNRGSSNEVRVYVDGIVSGNSFTKAFKKYAEFKNQYGEAAMLLLAASEDGKVVQLRASTKERAFLFLMTHITSDNFSESLKEAMKEYIKDNYPAETANDILNVISEVQ